MQGKTLKQRIHQKPFSTEEIFDIDIQVDNFLDAEKENGTTQHITYLELLMDPADP